MDALSEGAEGVADGLAVRSVGVARHVDVDAAEVAARDAGSLGCAQERAEHLALDRAHVAQRCVACSRVQHGRVRQCERAWTETERRCDPLLEVAVVLLPHDAPQLRGHVQRVVLCILLCSVRGRACGSIFRCGSGVSIAVVVVEECILVAIIVVDVRALEGARVM